MVQALEADIVPRLEALGVLPAEAQDLTAPDPGEPALSLVFDREGWSPALFRALLTSDADFIPEPRSRILRVRFLGLGSDDWERSLGPLIDELNQNRTRYPGTDMTLTYEMARSTDQQTVAKIGLFPDADPGPVAVDRDSENAAFRSAEDSFQRPDFPAEAPAGSVGSVGPEAAVCRTRSPCFRPRTIGE